MACYTIYKKLLFRQLILVDVGIIWSSFAD
jgi:hypothetical protein